MNQIATDYIFGSDHPDLIVYRKDFGTKFEMDRWAEGIKTRCDLAGFHNKRILEVGCGFGWDAVGLAVLGKNEVVATDILPSMIDGTNQCLAAAKAKGHDLKVEAMQGDICSLPLPDESFDGIYSSEAIEHVHDLAAMFRRCRDLLKPGGTILIVNDSNRYNSEFRESTFGMWKERDGSWEHAEWLKREIRPVEHAEAKPYAAMREAILSEEHSFAKDDLVKVVTATAGMTRPEIKQAATTFKESRKLPTPDPFGWCRNPETGEYAERLLDPFELRDMLKDAGFRNVQLRHGFTKFPHRLLNGVALRPLNEFLFDRRGVFLLLAEK